MEQQQSFISFGLGSRVQSSDDYEGRLSGVVFHRETGESAAIVDFTEERVYGSFMVPWRSLEPDPQNGLLCDLPLQTIAKSPLSAPSFKGQEESEVAAVRARPRRPKESQVVQQRSRGPRVGRYAALLLLLLLIGLTGIFGYVVYDVGWARATSSVEEAAREVKDLSVDATTTARVKTALALSRSVSAFDVNVDTVQGVVTLSGTLPSESARSVALAIAEDTTGVAAVRDQLSVDRALEVPPSPSSGDLARRVADLETRVLVREALESNELTSNAKIQIDVQNGRVVLSGNVSDARVAAEAERIARSISGVHSVESHLKVTSTTRF